MIKWLFIGILITAVDIYAQKSEDKSILKAFDQRTGTQNLGINNGPLHFNPYRSIDKTHRYYLTADYIAADVIYDDQLYPDILLKYDLLDDNLIIKLPGQGNSLGFELIREKTASFTIGNQKFKNVSLIEPHPDFMAGYYEELPFENVSLYIKYRKDRIEVHSADILQNKYVDREDYIFKTGNNYHRITSARDVTAIFPNQSKAIEDFYQRNVTLQKSDYKLFMKNLAMEISTAIKTSAR